MIMKRIEEIYEEHECSKRRDILDAMEAYALEAVKADREDAAEKAKTTCTCSVWNCEGESVDKKSITNRPIELP